MIYCYLFLKISQESISLDITIAAREFPSSSLRLKTTNRIEVTKTISTLEEEDLNTKGDLVESMRRQTIGETNSKTKIKKINQDRKVLRK